MCASAMFNSSISSSMEPSTMINFKPSIQSNHLISTSPLFSLQRTNPLSIDQNVNTLNSNNNLLSFSCPNSKSPAYLMEAYCKSDEMKVEYKKKAKSCMICGDAAFYFFYGSLCCDACRTFFRRSSLQNSKHLKCPFNNKCVINTRTRKDCSKCRLDKCLEVGMRQDLIVNAKEERKRKQSINLYDFQFNATALNSAPISTPNLYNSFMNNFGTSAIQNEYDQYLQSALNYANAYYMHNSMNGFNTNLLNSLKTTNSFNQTVQSSSLNQLDTLNSTLNSLNQLNYSSSPFLFNSNNENSNSSLDATGYFGNQLINSSPNNKLHPFQQTRNASNFSNSMDDKSDALPTINFQHLIDQQSINNHLSNSLSNDHLTQSQLQGRFSPNQASFNQTVKSVENYKIDNRLSNQFNSKESRNSGTFNYLNRPIHSPEDMKNQRKLSFTTSNDDNAEDGFDQYSNEIDLDKIDFNKLDLNKSSLPTSFSSSLSSSSSCSSLSSSYTCSNNQIVNYLELEHAKLLNNYNWKKRKIQYLTDEEIEKENRKMFRTFTRQNQLNKQRLDEIQKASKRVMKTPDYKLNDCNLNEENTINRSHLLEALRWSFFGITKLCKAFQEITAYKQLDETEKKCLLMANCTTILMISSSKYYNFETQSWDINVKLNNQENKKIKMPVPIEVMNNGSKKELASFYIKFMNVFDQTWLIDEVMMTLIFVICLFTPDEKLIKSGNENFMNKIKFEHEFYLNLLDDYLDKKLKCRERVKSQKNRIKKFLNKLAEFKIEFEAAHVVLEKEETFQLYRHLSEQLSV